MTQLKYRTTKLPEYHFKRIEEYLNSSDRYVSVSDFLRSAIEDKLSVDKVEREEAKSFLALKDIVFSRSRLILIHDSIAKRTPVENISLLKKDFAKLVDNSLDMNFYKFLARFVYNFMKFHPFVDGNKRTAFVATDVFLRLNNKKLNITTDKDHRSTAEKFIWQISTQQKDVPEITKFLSKHVQQHISSNDFEMELKKCLTENELLLENLSA